MKILSVFRVALFLALLITLLSSCLITTILAQQSPSRPLIFIPGILGSKLINQNGDLLWGGRSSYLNFHKLTLPRDDSQICLKPDGVIDTIPIAWPFEVKQYSNLLKRLKDINYIEGENFFTFAYDWRRSNFKTAQLLNEFITKTSELNNRKFDIIAHSMGGLVSLILINEYDSGKNVSNLITLGTPFLGSLDAFDMFLNGFKGVNRFMAHIDSNEDEIRSVMFSFESGYELLPSYTTCCILGKKLDPRRKPVNIFNLSFWQHEWLPSTFSQSSHKQFVLGSLKRGEKISDLVRKALPQSVELYMYVGDKFDTKTQVYLDFSGQIDTYTNRNGDGTVWKLSAARNDIPKSRVSFGKHAKIFEDDHLLAELDNILNPIWRLENFASTSKNIIVTSKNGIDVPVESVFFEVTPPIVHLGDPIKVVLELNGSEIEKSKEEFVFSVCTSEAMGSSPKDCVDLSEKNTIKNGKQFRVDYHPSVPGHYTIVVKNYGELEDYFAVLEVSN